jgi:hypothetical protein
MASPFPGMDPYLESPAIFPDLHDSLSFLLREALNAQLPPPYYAGSASRVWVEATDRRIGPDVDVLRPRQSGNGAAAAGGGGVAVAEELPAGAVLIHVPHDEVREQYLEIYTQPGAERVVTTIEILSLSNKTPRAHGRAPYLQKQQEVLESQVHLVEIDLLRAGVHSTAVPLADLRRRVEAFDYHVSVHRFDRWEDYLVFAFRLADRLPAITVPLLPEHGSVRVDLQPLLDRCYDSGLYSRRARYREQPEPPLRPDQAAWAESILRGRGLLG